MVVVCKVKKCPYNSKNNFCRNKLVAINSSGMCGHIYKNNGAIKLDWEKPIDEKFKEVQNGQQ